MTDIFHHFPVKGPLDKVFLALSTPAGLDSWWTKSSSGEPTQGAKYELGFGSGYEWRAVVSRCAPNTEFVLTLTSADKDWQGTRVGFLLEEKDGLTQVSFHHTGWPEDNEHYRISCYCWAIYLRLMKRYVEYSEVVPYEDRLEV
jgi:uncharacterized protein YndB with AHSA1/START domain